VPTEDEIATMGRLAAEGIEAGALGFTTSRTYAHESADGRPTPSRTATRDELVGIASAVGATRKGVFEVVADFEDLEAEFALLRAMAEVSRRPLSILVIQRPNVPVHDYRRLLELIGEAVADGIPVYGQAPARPGGLIMSLEGRIHPLVASPTYQSVAARPLADQVAELLRPETRTRVLAELAAGPGARSPLDIFPFAFVMGDPARYDSPPDESLAAEAVRRGVSVYELAYDALLERGGRGSIYVPVTNYEAGNLDAVREMLLDEHTVPGLGDAGAHCTMICDASYPTYLLTYWGRDAPADQRLPVEWLVKQQCADTAALVGLHDRGVVARGYRADLNVVDFAGLTVRRPEMRADLPAGGRRLVQLTAGYAATLVAGEVIYRDGAPTGSLPGRLVRGPQGARA
jgi:N-acyl-D-aspartate/D-glutamate deacylase